MAGEKLTSGPEWWERMLGFAVYGIFLLGIGGVLGICFAGKECGYLLYNIFPFSFLRSSLPISWFPWFTPFLAVGLAFILYRALLDNRPIAFFLISPFLLVGLWAGWNWFIQPVPLGGKEWWSGIQLSPNKAYNGAPVSIRFWLKSASWDDFTWDMRALLDFEKSLPVGADGYFQSLLIKDGFTEVSGFGFWGRGSGYNTVRLVYMHSDTVTEFDPDYRQVEGTFDFVRRGHFLYREAVAGSGGAKVYLQEPGEAAIARHGIQCTQEEKEKAKSFWRSMPRLAEPSTVLGDPP
jgi:hypothetical protein